MAYFEHSNHQEPAPERHRRVFQQPVVDEPEDDEQDVYDEDLDADYDDDYEYVDPEDMTDDERAQMHRDRWRVLAGVGDFLAVIAGTVVILLLVMLLISLINWVHADITQSFTLWQTKL